MPDAGRVITGSAGGLRLAAPGAGTRPLGDKVKQALFSLVEATRPDAWSVPMLDLFAGSGAAGIEALSRGAPAAVLVERDPGAVRVIRRNLEHTRLGDRAEVVRRDVLAFLAAGAGPVPQAPFGVAVLDPPYEQVDDLVASLERLAAPGLGWLGPGACVVVKHFWRSAPSAAVGDLHRTRERRFGETALSVYRRGESGARPDAEGPDHPDVARAGGGG